MTKKKALNLRVHSIKIRLLIAVIISLALAAATFFLVRTGIINWVENSYNAPEAKQDRLDGYVEDLQNYVTKNNLSSQDTEEITRWLRGSRNVYLFLYKDNRLFFTGGFPEEEEGSEEEKTEGEGDADPKGDAGTDADADPDRDPEAPEENEGGDAADPTPPEEGGEDNAPEDEGDEGSDAEAPGEEGEEEPVRPGGSSRPNTGLTVTIPTKEEIIQHATDNGLQPLELSDGTLFASFVDFSDYFYYNLSTVVSIASALLLAVVILMIYFHSITVKITRLADDVSGVYEEDMNRSIRTLDGKDEISELTRNVEQMRCSMLEGLKKEREALDANSELITSMSHDIRTPLTVLLGYLDIIKTYPVDEELSEYVKAAENTALRLKDFSDDMFRYFLVFGGKELDVSLSDYDAQTLFEQLLSEHLLLLRERGFTVDLQFDTSRLSGAVITTDAPKLMRVIDNLFSNLYKYAEMSRPVTITAAANDESLRLTMKNAVMAASHAESNGVGLRTCRKICEALDVYFDYGEREADGESVFVSEFELKIKKGEA